VRIPRKLDAVVTLLGVVVSLTAICPCLPPAPSRAAQATVDEQSCCSSGASPSLVAAADGYCVDHMLTGRSAATPSAGASLSADTGVATLAAWNRSEIRAPRGPQTGIVSHPPSVLRI
jgi:hypothetical protein